MAQKITLYAMVSCEHCQQAKDYLEKNNIAFDYVNFDALMGEERNAATAVLNKAAMFPSFPTFKIGEKLLVGFNQAAIDAIQEAVRAQ